MAKFNVECTQDALRDGKTLFRKGKKYPVETIGAMWKTKDEYGGVHELNTDNPSEIEFFNQYFKKD